MTRRVAPLAVLGYGAVTPVGPTADASWSALAEGRTAVSWDGDRHVARVPPLDADARSPGAIESRVVAMACRSVGEAFVDAAARTRPRSGAASWVDDFRRAAVVVGTSAGVRTEWDLTGGDVFDPQLSIEGVDLFHGIATSIGAAFDIEGPCLTVNTACSSGATATSVAASLIRSGQVPAAIVCGAEEYTPFSAWGFEMLGAYASEPTAPFDASDGLTLGEGAGALILAPVSALPEQARGRGFLVGDALTSDAHHPTAPEPTGAGVERAIRQALSASGVSDSDIGYVNVHGTGTALNDAAEFDLLSRVLPSGALASGIKGATGHGLGAAGALELIVTLRALGDGVAPPTATARPHERQRDDLLVGHGRLVLDGESKLPPDRVAGVTINQAFGGHDSALVCLGPEADVDRRSASAEPEERVSVAGASASVSVGHDLLPGALLEAWPPIVGVGDVDENPLVPPHEWIRLDQLSRRVLTAVSGSLEAADALDGTEISPAATGWGLAIATEKGPVDSYEKLHRAITRGRTPNPAIFPRLVVTAAAGTAAQACGLTGPLLTFTAGRNGAIGALEYARHLVATGVVDGMVVAGADMDAGYLHDDPAKPDARRFPDVGFHGVAAVVLTNDARSDGPLLKRIAMRSCFDRDGWKPTSDPTPYEGIAGALEPATAATVYTHEWQETAFDTVPVPSAYGAMAPLIPVMASYSAGGSEDVVCLSADELGSVAGYRLGKRE